MNLVTTTQEEHDLTELKEQLLELPLEGKIVGILHILNDSLSDVVKVMRQESFMVRISFYEKLLGLQFKITPFSFFQPNSGEQRYCMRLSGNTSEILRIRQF